MVFPVQFSCLVVSDSLWPHGLQHNRFPCRSSTPGAYSNSCPLSWCHPTISSSAIPFSSHLFSSSHVQMWELDHKEGWALKNWCILIVVLEKTLENPLDMKEIKPVNPRGNKSWVFTGRTDAKAEAPVLWPPDVKNWLLGKDSDAEKVWRQEEKGMTRGWDVWMVSLTHWIWVWANSRSWWWTGRPGMLHSMGLQRVGHNWATELNWTWRRWTSWCSWCTASSLLNRALFCSLVSHIVPSPEKPIMLCLMVTEFLCSRRHHSYTVKWII